MSEEQITKVKPPLETAASFWFWLVRNSGFQRDEGEPKWGISREMMEFFLVHYITFYNELLRKNSFYGE